MLLHMVADQVAGMVADMGAGMVADKVADMVVGIAADKKNIIVLAWHIVAHGARQGGGMVNQPPGPVVANLTHTNLFGQRSILLPAWA